MIFFCGLALKEWVKGFKKWQGAGFQGHGAVGIGCVIGLSEVAEVMAVGKWFQSLMVQGKELNRTGWLVCSWCTRCAPLVLGLHVGRSWWGWFRSSRCWSGTASGVSRGSCVVQGCTISDCQAAIVRYQVSCLWSCCKRTLLLDNVPFQAVGHLSACTCRGPRQLMRTPP